MTGIRHVGLHSYRPEVSGTHQLSKVRWVFRAVPWMPRSVAKWDSRTKGASVALLQLFHLAAAFSCP